MEPKKMIELTVGIVVGLVVFSAILMPVLNDATATHKTFTNEGLYKMASFDENTEMVIAWDHTDPTKFTIGDEIIELPAENASSFPPSLLASDTWGVRYLNQSGTVTLTVFDNTKSTTLSVVSADTADLTITLSAGTATISDGTNTATESYTAGFVIANEGDYIMKKSSVPAYLNGDSIIYSTGRSGGLNLQSSTISIHLDGNIADGVDVESLFPTTYTTSNVVINDSAVTGYKDLYSFSNVTFDVTDTNSQTDDAVYSQVIVPASVTAEISEHMTPMMIGLMNTIPILIIAGLIVGIAATVVSRRE